MFWKKDLFKEEQREWYQKLKDSGFDDIEIGDNLKQHAENAYRGASELERASKLKYYSLLDQFMQENAPEFDDSLDYFVMHQFARGLKNKQIYDMLERLGKRRHRKTIMYIRRKYENRWGIRIWSPDQLKSKVMRRSA